ncbi:MAG: 50S ribosomal protein L13 [Chloroflexota bacterium]
MKTYSARPADIERAWHLIDAADQTLGRLSTRIARLLMGKHKPMFTPSQDTGDFVVVINAEKVRVTGNKGRQKLYYRHSGYPGGFKSVTLEKMMQNYPTRAIEHAVNGMLPHTRLGAQMKKKLRVYAGAAHPHESQFQTGKKEAK